MPDDREYMKRALDLAARAIGRTSPNPVVGAVVVKDGEVVGEGYHEGAGRPHAEVCALKAAGEKAHGATLYVTLEPCCHHGRTPPCTDAIISAGVKRVVAAMVDPDPRVRGRGLDLLRKAGVDISVGLLACKAVELNEPFVTFKTLGRPMVILKWAMTLDGKIASRTGASRWITGEEARRVVHRLRDRYDAVCVGVGTVLADDPALTCRIPGGRNPVRVVLDSNLRTPQGALVIGRDGRCLIFTASDNREKRERLEEAGATVVRVAPTCAGVDISEVLARLGDMGILSLLVEGGAQVHGSFVAAGLVDRVYAFVSPKLMGGKTAPGPVGGPGATHPSEALPLGDIKVVEVEGGDLLITARRIRGD